MRFFCRCYDCGTFKVKLRRALPDPMPPWYVCKDCYFKYVIQRGPLPGPKGAFILDKSTGCHVVGLSDRGVQKNNPY
jgi:hypothetical protein